ncbi:similar to An16g05010 [Aspergillus luchuensis]|uniref:Similar to An16g05010 n=1 Tax=Aspergillus kawachii TaxID=1069201 RepID=A0A146FFE1_ASPKA|nr:similar to An16g05010 [Aspergillus luchuensis]
MAPSVAASLPGTHTAAIPTVSDQTNNMSTSDGLHASPYVISTAHPTSSRRHRSSSSLSSSYIPAVQGSRAGSVSGIAPARETYLPSTRPDPSRPGRSRESSLTSHRQSEGALPSTPGSHHQTQPTDHAAHHAGSYPHRSSLSQQKTPSISSTSRHEEVLQQRGEVDSLKRENEMLRRRVRDLESVISKLHLQESNASHLRDDNSPSTPTPDSKEPSGTETKE